MRSPGRQRGCRLRRTDTLTLVVCALQTERGDRERGTVAFHWLYDVKNGNVGFYPLWIEFFTEVGMIG